jgi:hypothetical protein
VHSAFDLCLFGGDFFVAHVHGRRWIVPDQDDVKTWFSSELGLKASSAFQYFISDLGRDCFAIDALCHFLRFCSLRMTSPNPGVAVAVKTVGKS